MMRSKVTVSLFLLTAVAHAPAALAQTEGAPPHAYSAAGAFDPARGLVIFGGFLRGGYSGDTWEFAGDRWSRSTRPGPSGRNGPAMVYDSSRHQLVLFGGDTRTTGPLGDTWLRDGEQWREIVTAGPPARSVFAMTWDSKRSRVVLFGGAGTAGLLNDTWEWNGAQWSRRATDGPSARTLHAMAFDPVRGRVVLYGGAAVLDPEASALDDTWEWDGTTWREIRVRGPGGRNHHAMHWDPARRVIVLYGGMGPGGEHGNETWGYDGTTWRRLPIDGPRRRFPVMALDSRAGSLLLFGGFDDQPSSDLFRLGARGWSLLTPK
ncbi:MAG: kelch repeat-containing protein [Gemmatimonadota bacterium]